MVKSVIYLLFSYQTWYIMWHYIPCLIVEWYKITALERDQYEVLWSRVQQYWTRRSRVQYWCTLLHTISYWSSSSVVIVYYIRLYCTLILKFYENFQISETFWKFYHFEFFGNLMKFLKVLKFCENLEFFKKNEILRNFWNFQIF